MQGQNLHPPEITENFQGSVYRRIWGHLFFGFAGRSKFKRVAETAWRFSYYICIWVFGLVVLRKEPQFGDVIECFRNWPKHHVPEWVFCVGISLDYYMIIQHTKTFYNFLKIIFEYNDDFNREKSFKIMKIFEYDFNHHVLLANHFPALVSQLHHFPARVPRKIDILQKKLIKISKKI